MVDDEILQKELTLLIKVSTALETLRKEQLIKNAFLQSQLQIGSAAGKPGQAK